MDHYNEAGAQSPVTDADRSDYEVVSKSPTNIRTQRADSKDVAPAEMQESLLSAAASMLPSSSQQQQQPFVDAVNNAFGKSPSVASIDPSVINQIAEEVIKKLLSDSRIGLASSTSHVSQQVLQPPQSPGLSSIASFPPRYTPPSPHIDVGAFDNDIAFIAPDQPQFAANPFTTQLGAVGQHLDSPSSPSSECTPRPSQPPDRRSSNGPEELEKHRAFEASDKNRTEKLESYSITHETSDPVTQDTKNATTSNDRIAPARTPESPCEASLLEKAWQPLFTNADPTPRLSQFLRGLAAHLIDHFEPRNSLVITPTKMLRFFERTRASQERYPWLAIFGGHISHASICIMYRKLLCQHHLVQVQPHDQPSVPGLTPIGFETLMTCLMQAHPDIEFERMSRVVRDMPISNADDSRERFPKELSRRLFPSKGQVQAEQRLISSLSHETALVDLEHVAATMPPPPPPLLDDQPPLAHSISAPERTRASYQGVSQSSNAFDDDDLFQPAVQLERERKPYSAREGSGKFYDVNDSHGYEHDHVRNVDRFEASQLPYDPPSSRPTHSVPGLSRSYSYKNGTRTQPINVPISGGHRKSMNQARHLPPSPPPPSTARNLGHIGPHRRSSTPPRYNNARNDPARPGGGPQTQYGGGYQPDTTQGGASGAPGNDFRRYAEGRPLERSRTMNEEAGDRGRPVPGWSTSQTQNWHDQGYNAAGSPPGNGHGLGPSGTPDGRRHSAWAKPSGRGPPQPPLPPPAPSSSFPSGFGGPQNYASPGPSGGNNNNGIDHSLKPYGPSAQR